MKTPVFIFSTGPACGSKFVQELVSSSKQVLVWSAPPGALNHILEAMRLMDMSLSPGVMGVLSGTNKSKVQKKILKPEDDARPHVANMRFSVKHMQRSFQQLFATLYAMPSSKFGFDTWGITDHTANRQTCDMLRMIYPDAKFVFVIRHPIDCLRQIKKISMRPRDHWGRLLEEKSPLDWFAANWARLADDFYEMPNTFSIRYEDMVSGKLDIAALNQYLGAELVLNPEKMPKSNSEEVLDNISEPRIQKIKANIHSQMARWNYK
jgi:hypothetical protein